MDALRKNGFTPWMLARGLKSYEDGRVTRILQQGNTICATVKGTEEYNTEVDLPGGMLTFARCTCPYAAQENCKHMAALLYAVDAGEFTFTDEMPEKMTFTLLNGSTSKSTGWMPSIAFPKPCSARN